jgi:hypothetical protein
VHQAVKHARDAYEFAPGTYAYRAWDSIHAAAKRIDELCKRIMDGDERIE